MATVTLCSCSAPPSRSADYRLDPLAFRQRRAYAEAAGGRFVSLADFEDTPDSHGWDEINHFSVVGDGSRSFTVNVTATGSGAMDVLLSPGADLRFDLPDIRNFTGYALLSMAVHGSQIRDDLQVTLYGPDGDWTSSRRLVRPGWNTVMVDLRRAGQDGDLALSDVRAVALRFTDSADDVRFVLDDVLLIDNRREISPVPAGMGLWKEGLDYRISLPGRDDEIRLAQSADGLWRMGDHQPVLSLDGGEGESLEALGARAVGHVELVEHNNIRVRLVSNWYFPDRPGAWASMAVRKVVWEHTFYGDGRWVCSTNLDAAGAGQFSGLRIRLPSPAAVAGRGISDRIDDPDFTGPVGRWSYLDAPAGEQGRLQEANYLDPQRITPTRAGEDSYAAGDANRDRFDESQGCFVVSARDGRCRFGIEPNSEPLIRPVFRVIGPWSEAPMVTAAGMRVKDVTLLKDGSALFVLPGSVRSPMEVEVIGPQGEANISPTKGDP